jgi:hypothetical protein
MSNGKIFFEKAERAFLNAGPDKVVMTLSIPFELSLEKKVDWEAATSDYQRACVELEIRKPLLSVIESWVKKNYPEGNIAHLSIGFLAWQISVTVNDLPRKYYEDTLIQKDVDEEYDKKKLVDALVQKFLNGSKATDQDVVELTDKMLKAYLDNESKKTAKLSSSHYTDFEDRKKWEYYRKLEMLRRSEYKSKG